MDHVCYLDIKSGVYEKLLKGTKTMIIRGANRKIIPYERVFSGDTIYFVDENDYDKAILKANVLNVINLTKMTKKESNIIVNKYQYKLQLTVAQYKKWAGKEYIVLIEVNDVEKIEAFNFDNRGYGLINGWILVGNIESVKK